ncbi:MAG: membrane protein required for colicin V production [bacterium]|jgi:membrane protein required for colicin V production
MNIFDITFIVIFASSFILGFIRGFLKEASAIAGVLAGYLLAGKYSTEYVYLIKGIIQDPKTAELVIYLAIFATGIFIGVAAGYILDMVMIIPIPSISTRIFAGCIGLAKASIANLAIFYLVISYVDSFKDELEQSLFYPYFKVVINFMKEVNLI